MRGEGCAILTDNLHQEGDAAIRFLSVCSGVEAASLALEPVGFEAVGFSEIEPFPSEVLRQRFPGIQNYGDMTKWREWDLQEADMLIGGTPCQSFSVAGLRRSLGDARGNLSLQFADLFHARGFVLALWENVPGVLSTNDNAFGCFLGGLVGSDAPLVPTGRNGRGRAGGGWQWVKHRRFRRKGKRMYRKGYWKPVWPSAGMAAGPLARVAWKILDAQHFELAQRRKRVFVVASAGSAGPDPAAILFEPQSMQRDFEAGREARADVAGAIGTGASDGGGWRIGPDEAAANHVIAIQERAAEENPNVGPDGRGWRDDGLAYTLEARQRPQAVCFGGNNTTGPIDVATAVNAHGGPHGRLDFESETFVAHTLRAEGYDASEDGTGRSTPIVPVYGGAIRGRHGGAQIEVEEDLSPALRASSAIALDEPPLDARRDNKQCFGVRRLIPVETERLQGMPDGWTDIVYRGKPSADGARYMAVGNSFAVHVVRWIGERIKAEVFRWRAKAAA